MLCHAALNYMVFTEHWVYNCRICLPWRCFQCVRTHMSLYRFELGPLIHTACSSAKAPLWSWYGRFQTCKSLGLLMVKNLYQLIWNMLLALFQLLLGYNQNSSQLVSDEILVGWLKQGTQRPENWVCPLLAKAVPPGQDTQQLVRQRGDAFSCFLCHNLCEHKEDVFSCDVSTLRKDNKNYSILISVIVIVMFQEFSDNRMRNDGCNLIKKITCFLAPMLLKELRDPRSHFHVSS